MKTETKVKENGTGAAEMALAPAENNTAAIVKHEATRTEIMAPVAFNKEGALPDLGNATVAPMDLMADYWTPETVGESKRLYFDRIATRMVADQQTGEMLELECAFFIEVVNGEAKSISNGSKRLVGAIQNCNMQQYTPVQITYIGKKNNATNGFKSDNWSVKPLQLNIAAQ